MLAVAVGLALGAAPAWAAGEEVKFDSADGVELKGTYYPSPKGKKAFTVLMLHSLDTKASSKSDAWGKLAEELQKSGCAVLAFDFRGYGDSTAIDKSFWMQPANQRFVKGFSATKPKESILAKDFLPGYAPVLVNDVMAAKTYLDRRNDAGECNSGKTIIIGAGEGATLGLMFSCAECNRFLLLPTGQRETKAQGKDIACVIGLSMSPSLGAAYAPSGQGGKRAPVDTYLKKVGVDEKIPVAFIYGADELNGQKNALSWLKTDLKVDTSKNKPDPERPFTWHVGIAKTKLSGQNLVSEKLSTIEKVTGYIAQFAKDEKAENWEKREAEKNAYVWVFPNGIVPAKVKDQRSMNLVPLPALGFTQ